MKNPRLKSLISPAMMLCLLILISLSTVSPAAAQDEVSDLLGRINNLRASVGRAPYTLNSILSAAARQQAQWMVDTGTIDHFHPDGSNPRSRAMNAGYPSAMVSENIYGGTNAGVGDAWTFWINSPIHYAGLTSPNYADVGIGSASSGWGRAFVLVFGNPGGTYPAANSSSGSSGSASSGSGNSAASAPARIYAIGYDEYGNIKHLIATGDTMGDIALIYGYTWDDIPGMLALNNIDDPRALLPGEVFLVPPHDGTYTPTPGGPTNTPPPTSTPLPATVTPFIAVTSTPAIPTANPLPAVATIGVDGEAQTFATPVIPPDVLATMRVSELAANPTTASQELTPSPEVSVQVVAALTTPVPATLAPTGTPPRGTPSSINSTVSSTPRNSAQTWITIALVVQVGLIAAASIEFVRRALVRRSGGQPPETQRADRRPRGRAPMPESPPPPSGSSNVIGQQIKRGRR